MNKSIRHVAAQVWRGLFLEPDAYDEAADSPNPFVEGLFMVAFVGLLVGVAAGIGGLLDWAITPDLGRMRELILQGLQAMPWFEFLRGDAEALRQFDFGYDLGWRISEIFQPSALNLLSQLILTPLGLILSWLWFALIAQGVARLLGGNGTTRQTLGATALAVAPNLLNIFGLLPMVSVAAVGVWTLLARYVALRRVHENLTWGRTLIALLAPAILFVLLIVLLSLLLSSLFAALIGGLFS
ncbi:MAG: YIP1 family protein [Caldilineales bacterium]|nr:YIP1 family protein [Caldilineales bacterium]